MELRKIHFICVFFMVCAIILSCTPTSPNTNGVGGALPTHYISILANSISPNNLTVSIGSSITFVNQSSSNQTLVSDNCNLLDSILIVPSRSLIFKPDTVGTITYHSIEFPMLRGQITFRP